MGLQKVSELHRQTVLLRLSVDALEDQAYLGKL